MTNEEKILSILDAIQTDMADLKTGVTGLKADVADIHDRLLRVELTQENQVLPQIEALAEGQQTILETLAPKSRVESLEDEVAFMKLALKALSQEVAELKQAQ